MSIVRIAAVLAASTLITALALATPAVAQTEVKSKSTEKIRVVFHVSEDSPQKWNIVLNNAGNIQDEFGKDNILIEIVTHGPGIDMLKSESKVGARLAQAMDRNISLYACENTMRNAKVTKDDMYGGISFAPSGVAHILTRQKQGWLYLRP